MRSLAGLNRPLSDLFARSGCKDLDELIGKQREDAEHQVHARLRMAADSQVPEPELILQTAVASLRCTALVVTARPRPFPWRGGHASSTLWVARRLPRPTPPR